MSRRIALLGVVLAVVTMLGCAGRLGAGDGGSGGIPDEVMLHRDDVEGASIASGAPDPAVHPLPPWPCADAVPAAPAAERVINATYGRYQVYEYVARYPTGEAERAVTELRAQLARCAKPVEGEAYRVLAGNSAGVLFQRDYSDGDATAAYYAGHAGDYLVVVLEVGNQLPNGDPTIVADLGRRALIRAGGSPDQLVPDAGTSSGPAQWSTYQAEVTGVRRGTDPHTLLIDVALIAGHPECARDPKVDQYTEENQLIYANVVFESARSQVRGGCPDTMAAVTTLTAPDPIGDRTVVLNHEPWAPSGATGYRRCDAQLGCAPPADHCASTWVLAAVQGLDVPRNSTRHIEHCDEKWLVLTVNANSTVCGAEPRPGCSAPPAVTRYFLRFADRWEVFAQTTTAGCATVRAAEPAFPRARCEDLPATR